jgi:hypothetical protein
MREYIAFDSHKHYTWAEHEEVATGRVRQYRLRHGPGAVRRSLAGCQPGTAVALEATPIGTGSWTKLSKPVWCPSWCIRAGRS